MFQSQLKELLLQALEHERGGVLIYQSEARVQAKAHPAKA